MRDNETVVVTEVFYGLQPMFFDTPLLRTQLVAADLYSDAVFRPRFSSLTTINPRPRADWADCAAAVMH